MFCFRVRAEQRRQGSERFGSGWERDAGRGMLGLSAQLVLGITETCVWTPCVSVSKSDSGQVAMKCKEEFYLFLFYFPPPPPIFRASKLEKRSPVLFTPGLSTRVSYSAEFHSPHTFPPGSLSPSSVSQRVSQRFSFPLYSLPPPFASSPLLVIHRVNEALVIFTEQEVC